MTFQYGSDSVTCHTHGSKEGGALMWHTLDRVLDAAEGGLPSLITSLGFIVCVLKLSSSSPTEASRRRNNRAAVTVTIFTGLFLVCNLPYFVVKVLELVSVMMPRTRPFSSHAMFWYSWTVSYVLCTVLNATLNPLLYYWRMPGLKRVRGRTRRVYNGGRFNPHSTLSESGVISSAPEQGGRFLAGETSTL